jgi:hypothetical protein
MENRETRQISEFKLIDELERNTLFMNISNGSKPDRAGLAWATFRQLNCQCTYYTSGGH